MNIEHKMPPRTPSGEKTTYEQIFERGMGVGIEKGVEKTIQTYMLKNLSVSDQEIADTFDVPLDFVRQIRARN